ncbi:MAG: 16S rRNA (guanine(966)-N(2))-methyltransferase RsmD [Paracoccaceae bacterium]
MRIIAGQHRGIRLAALGKGDPAAHLRPTSDRVRESLFSILTTYVDWDGAMVLDLFAGTGALGFESLSRGAKHVTFVDNGRSAQRLIQENTLKLKAEQATRMIAMDATRLGPAPHTCDVVFLDPPYGKNIGASALQSAQHHGWLSETALIVWEENAPQLAPLGFVALDQRRYGDTHITLMQVQ